MAELEQRGGHRVLQELIPLPFHRCGPNDGLRCAVVVDPETTGLTMPRLAVTEGAEGTTGTLHSEIVSLAMVAIAYDPVDGDIKGTIGRFHALREPSHPIPSAATAGLDRGCRQGDERREFIRADRFAAHILIGDAVDLVGERGMTIAEKERGLEAEIEELAALEAVIAPWDFRLRARPRQIREDR